jgi:class 3 adenylate cyclase
MKPERIQGLVACSDLTGYAKYAAKKTEEEIFQLLSDYYEQVGEIIAPAEGKVIKFMGDAALMLFPEESSNLGVHALLQLQSQGDAFLSAREVPCRHHVRVHFGSMSRGPLGTHEDKRVDILGSTVNAMFLLKSTGFAMTPEVFRQLEPETKELFRKQSDIYIPIENPYRE